MGHVVPLRSTVDAVELPEWLAMIRAAIIGGGDADVPCGTCTACCRSSQFVHVAPDEHDALAHIPGELVFPAPGLPPGHVVMGYDEDGRCPMLGQDGCSIYEHRPRTCRTYDCRVFAATGIDAEHPEIAAAAATFGFAPSEELDRLRAVARAQAAQGRVGTAAAVAAVMFPSTSGPAGR